jgi:branched-chain amino acid transport system substrate-binding protein
MSTKRLLLLVTIFLLASLMLMPVSAQDSAGTIKIYSSWPLTGGTQFTGESMLNASQLAIQHYLDDHDGVGPAGFTLELVPLDDASPTTGEWDGTIEAENAQRCVNDPECMVYYGTYNSGAAKVSMVITNEAGMAQISPANTYAGLTRAGCDGCAENEPDIYRPSGEVNYFRTPPTDDVQGAAGASWAYCQGYQNVYILDDAQAYGKGVADVFEAHATEIGLNVVGHSSVESMEIDFRALLTEVRSSGADVVYGGFVLTSGGPQIIQQMDSLGLFADGIKFIGADGLASQALVDQAGGADVVNGNVNVTFPGVLPNLLTTESGQRFYEDYIAEWGDPDPYAIYAYVATQVIIDSIERAGEADRGAILEAMRATSELDTIVGPFAFDENGDATTGVFYGYDFVDGAMANPTPLSPTMNEECEPGASG